MSYVKRNFKKCVDFSGRATRGEFWGFMFFMIIVAAAASMVDSFIYGRIYGPFSVLVTAVLFVPCVAVSVRRLHDTGRRGRRLFLGLIPIVGAAILLVDFCEKSNVEINA